MRRDFAEGDMQVFCQMWFAASLTLQRAGFSRTLGNIEMALWRTRKALKPRISVSYWNVLQSTCG